jgi:two-component system KDP operon response regulator KdpE
VQRILIVDDEPQLRRALELNLRAHHFEPTVAATGEEAIRLVSVKQPDLVMLDLGLPGMDGIDVLTALRAWTTVPVIVLTARHEEQSKLAAFDAGADDYLTKPFSIGELLARVRAVLRRSAPITEEPVVATDHFRVDLVHHAVTKLPGDEVVRLTPIEWAIVEHLVRHPDRLVTQRQLIDTVWSPTYDPDPTLVRVHLQHIRRKLEPDPTRPRYFVTEAGLGVRFVPGAAHEPA